MANKFQVKRTTVSGRTPNTTNSGNTHFIDTGELALNLTDGKMFSSNGSVYFEVGANLQNISITSNATFGSSGKIVANGSFGTAGQVLTSNGTTMYWSTVSGGGGSGTVTQVNTGVGLSGGPITTTGTISVVANDGIVANSTGLFANAGTGVVVNATGIHVNSSYIGTLAANSATYVGGNTALDLRNYSDTVAGTAYTNATAFAANATNISSGTLDAARLPATVVQNTDSRTLSGNLVISGTYFNPSSNTVLLGNSIQRWVVSANSVNALSILVGSNVSINVTTVQIGNSTYHANLTSTRMVVLGGSNGTYVNSDMVLVSTTTGTSYYMGSGANLQSTGTLNIGTANATANGFKANNNYVSVGNSSVNVTITTAGITSSGGTGVNPSSNSLGTTLGTSTQRWVINANTGDFTGTVSGTIANMSTSVNSALLTVGTSFIANTTGAYHTGTVNAASYTTSGFVANTTVIAPTSNTILLGNSIGRFVISANTIDASGLITASAGANISGTANLVDVNISGNLTVSGTTTYVNTTNLNVGDSIITLNADLTNVTAPTENAGLEVNRGSSANVSFLWNETSDSWTLGNTDITGYANATVSVNSALLTVGTSFIANTTGVYHTGTINAASFTTTNFTANTTGAYPLSNSAGTALGSSTKRWIVSANTGNFTGTVTGTVANMSTSVNSALLTVGTSFIANSSTVIAPTQLVVTGGGAIAEGGQIIIGYGNNLASSITGQANNTFNLDIIGGNTGSTPIFRAFYQNGDASITAGFNIANTGRMHVGSVAEQTDSTFKVTGTANVTTSVNSALLTVGTSFIANTTGVYHTGTVNAASITIGSSSFIANSTAIVIADPLTANGTTGTSGQVLTSNGATGAPYWADSGGGSGVARTVTSYSGNGSNTVYGVSYTAGYLDVYLNGIRLILGSDFTATNGTDVTFTTAPSSGDNIDLISYSQTLIAPVNARTVTNYTADGSTSTFNVTYDVGYLDVFVNGIKLSSGVDYTATSGSNVIFSTNPLNGDYLELVSYTVAPLQGDGSIRTVTYYTGDGSTTDYGINYDNGYLDVYVNGIKYKFGADYTASNGTGVSILSAPLVGDNIELVAYHNDATLLDVVLKAGDTMTGTLTVPVLTSSGNVSGVNGYFTTINAASHTIGSTLIANTSGVYHTGTINASSITIGSSSFVANSTTIIIANTLTANGTTGTSGDVLTSNGTTGSPYWAPATISVPNANTRVSSLGVGVVASGTTGEIRATDAITAYFSDRRLKENIKPIENAVEKVKQISGVTFNSNEVAEQYGYKNKNNQVGVIAQEIEAVLPEIVTAAPFDIGQREDGTEYSLSGENYKTVYYEKIVPLLIEAIKEQQVKIEQLESSIDQLSKRI